MAALKLLADNFASDSHVRDRFQREARVASERNHPNICTVYDIGQKSSSTKFLTEAAAFALGADGDFADAGKLAHELEQKYPLDTSVQNYIVRPFAHRTSCTRDGPRELSANFVNGDIGARAIGTGRREQLQHGCGADGISEFPDSVERCRS